MKNRIVTRCALLVLLAITPILAQVSQHDQRFSQHSIAIFDRHMAAIKNELRNTQVPDWAGEYYYGDGLGVNVTLKLAPQSGFAFAWDSCLGRYDLNYGEVTLVDGTIKLNLKYPNNRVGFQGIDPELLPITWGERHYLIPSHKMIDFANAVNAGMEPADWRGGLSAQFLLKRGDEKVAVIGQPTLPAQYVTYLLKEPIEARISSIKEMRTKKSSRVTVVILDVGEEVGLKSGMELFVKNPKNVYSSAVISSVSQHYAEALLESSRSDNVPSVGWKLSTKL